VNWGSDKINRTALVGATLCLVLLAASQALASGVEGRLVTVAGPVANPLKGGVVKAYRSVDFSKEPVAVSSMTGPDGKYSLDLVPGTWFLTAEASSETGKDSLWSWCGQNPVTVSPVTNPPITSTKNERQWIGFILEKWAAPVYSAGEEDSYDGVLMGTVSLDGTPGEKVNVTLYFDSADGFRGMGFLRAPPTGPDGRFQLEMVPEGRYYLIARKRESGQNVGPMMKGDLISWYRHNPVEIRSGKKVEVLLPLTPKKQDRDINQLAGDSNRAGFSGTVTDKQGRPVSGVHVFAYLEPEMGHHKPAALSSLTDSKGRYTISLSEPGRYYVGARDGYGDNPAPGELFGHYQGTPDHSLTLKSEETLPNVDMVVERVLVP
jgi:hypothetical protein